MYFKEATTRTKAIVSSPRCVAFVPFEMLQWDFKVYNISIDLHGYVGPISFSYLKKSANFACGVSWSMVESSEGGFESWS